MDHKDLKNTETQGGNATPASRRQKPNRAFRALMWSIAHWRITGACLLAVILLLLGWRLIQYADSPSPLLTITHTKEIEDTPEEIRALREIDQWEFLSVETEELVEHHEAHTLGDTHLVKIYRGRLRIGVDMSKAGAEWFRVDTMQTEESSADRQRIATLSLPDVGLLDENFIDETHTTTFYEKGKISPEAQEELYAKAAEAMKERTLTAENLATARRAAEEQFTKIIKALGYNSVRVTFVQDESKN